MRLLHFIFKSFSSGWESHKVFPKIVFDSFLLLPTKINKNIVSSFITTNYPYPSPPPHPPLLIYFQAAEGGTADITHRTVEGLEHFIV